MYVVPFNATFIAPLVTAVTYVYVCNKMGKVGESVYINKLLRLIFMFRLIFIIIFIFIFIRYLLSYSYLSDIKSYICLGAICICLGTIYRYLFSYSYSHLWDIKSYICLGAIYIYPSAIYICPSANPQSAKSACSRNPIFTLLK